MPSDRHGNERLPALTDADFDYLGTEAEEPLPLDMGDNEGSTIGGWHVADESLRRTAWDVAHAMARTDDEQHDYLRHIARATAELRAHRDDHTKGGPLRCLAHLWNIVAIDLRREEPEQMKGRARQVAYEGCKTAWSVYVMNGGDVRAAFQWSGWTGRAA
jgi:hypothetical protein